MHSAAVISICLALLLQVATAVPQIYTHLFRTPPVIGAPIAIQLPAAAAPAAPADVPTLYHHRQAWRNDGRCGAKNNPNGVFQRFVADNGHVAECNGHSAKPCCSGWGYCGIGVDNHGYDHCSCNSCTDYRPSQPSTVRWRPDARCGAKVSPDGEYHQFLLKNGNVAECNPNSSSPCCSSYGYCGQGTDKNGYSYCTCSTCEDYRWSG